VMDVQYSNWMAWMDALGAKDALDARVSWITRM
jgi:hypothetical protein